MAIRTIDTWGFKKQDRVKHTHKGGRVGTIVSFIRHQERYWRRGGIQKAYVKFDGSERYSLVALDGLKLIE